MNECTGLQVTYIPEAQHATSRSQGLPTIINIYELAVKKQFVSLISESEQARSVTIRPGSRVQHMGHSDVRGKSKVAFDL